MGSLSKYFFIVISYCLTLIVVQSFGELTVLSDAETNPSTIELTCKSEDDGAALIWNYNPDSPPIDIEGELKNTFDMCYQQHIYSQKFHHGLHSRLSVQETNDSKLWWPWDTRLVKMPQRMGWDEQLASGKLCNKTNRSRIRPATIILEIDVLTKFHCSENIQLNNERLFLDSKLNHNIWTKGSKMVRIIINFCFLILKISCLRFRRIKNRTWKKYNFCQNDKPEFGIVNIFRHCWEFSFERSRYIQSWFRVSFSRGSRKFETAIRVCAYVWTYDGCGCVNQCRQAS